MTGVQTCALPIYRQIKIRGVAVRVAESESDEYFASRPRASQIGAWASPQSHVLRDRVDLEERIAGVEARYPDGIDIPRPNHWGGWRIDVNEAEVWQGRPSRLHDRFRYRRSAGPGPEWVIERLAP